MNHLYQLSNKLNIPVDALIAFVGEGELVEKRPATEETNEDNNRRTTMDRMMQMMERIAKMSRIKKIMVMMGALLMAMIAMTMFVRDMTVSGM